MHYLPSSLSIAQDGESSFAGRQASWSIQEGAWEASGLEISRLRVAADQRARHALPAVFGFLGWVSIVYVVYMGNFLILALGSEDGCVVGSL